MSGLNYQIINQKIQLNFQYPVYFTKNIFSPTNPIFNKIVKSDRQLPKKILFLIDQGVINAHPKLSSSIFTYQKKHHKTISLISAPIIIPGGEESKNKPANLSIIYEAVSELGIDRHSFIAAVGGGAFIDMVGYATATAHRGIRLIRIPTTVLSQDDAAVGVKNGINAFNKKNFLGTFTPPYAVICDISFIKTVSDRDWKSGITEAIKVALLKDSSFFSFIEKHTEKLNRRDMAIMEKIIFVCARLHLKHIATSGDPFEFGSSRPLDFGHWSAHKLEQLSNYKIAHGEAVAIGIALDSTYAYLSGFLSKKSWLRIIQLIRALNLDIFTTELENQKSLLAGLNEFREHLGGKLTILLLSDIAKPFEVNKINTETVLKSIELLKELTKGRKNDYAPNGKKIISAY